MTIPKFLVVFLVTLMALYACNEADLSRHEPSELLALRQFDARQINKLNPDPDTLKALIKGMNRAFEETKNPEWQAKTLFVKGRLCYARKDWDSVFHYLHLFLEMDSLYAPNPAKSQTQVLAGEIYYEKALKVQARRAYQLGLKNALAIPDTGLIISAYTRLGTVERDFHDVPLATRYLVKALILAEKTNNKAHLGTIFRDLGVLYAEAGDSLAALRYLRLALARFSRDKHQFLLGEMYNELGIFYYHSKPDSSRYYLEKAFNLFSELDDHEMMVVVNYNLASILYDNRDYSKAAVVFREILKFSKEVNDNEGQAKSLSMLIPLYTALRDFNTAWKYVLQADSLEKCTTLPDFSVELMENKVNYFQAKGDYREALAWSSQLRRSISNQYSIEKQELSATIRSQYELERKAYEYYEIKKDLAGHRSMVNVQQRLLWSLSAIVFLTVGLLIVIIRNFRRNRRAKEVLASNQERFLQISLATRTVVGETNADGLFTYISPVALEVFGFSPGEIIGKIHFHDLFMVDHRDALVEGFRQHLPVRYLEVPARHASGHMIWLEVTASPVMGVDGVFLGYRGGLSDITDRKLSAEKVLKANRLYTFISEVNESMIRFGLRDSLLSEVCRIAVETGKFRMAWFGFLNPETGILQPSAYAGWEEGYLALIFPITPGPGPGGQGPTGTAVRAGRHFVVSDIETDPAMALWRELALQRGYRSSVALPIFQEGEPVGAFTLYAGQTGFFDADEISMLTRVVANIGFALDAIETEKQRNFLMSNLERMVQERTNQVTEMNRSLLVEIEERKKAEIEIMQARIEAEEANHAKSEFMSRMSHELRTPLNSILGFAQLLEMGAKDPRQERSIVHILQSGRHLLALINEVLDIARIESGHLSLTFESLQVREIIHEVLDYFRIEAKNRQVALLHTESPDDLFCIRADRQRLKQILLNLISNAIKYNHPGGKVELVCQLVKEPDTGVDHIRFTVADTGPGIPTEHIPRLFVPFDRLGAEKLGTEGTGLGLAVVKKLMDAMGGHIGVDSTLGVGTNFQIEFPLSEAPVFVPSPASGTRQGPSNRDGSRTGSILYVEDNLSNIELVRQILSEHRPGFHLETCTLGADTLSQALELNPDLILLDLNLPDQNGDEVLETLLQNEHTLSIPVVVVSADAMSRQIEKMIRAGARAYLTKPIDIHSFIELVDQYLPTP